MLAFGQMRDAGGAEHGDMDEHVLAAVVAGDEAEALGVVEPFDLAADRDRGRRIGRHAARRPRRVAENERCGRSTTPAVSTSTTRVTCAPLAPAPTNAQFGARRNRLVARGVQRVGVQERVALAAGQLDEAVALVGLEPFDDSVDRRSRRRDRRCAARPLARRQSRLRRGRPRSRARRGFGS